MILTAITGKSTMRSLIKIGKLLGLALGVAFALAACGGGSNNDQGVSFTLAGFEDSNGTPIFGTAVSLTSDFEVGGGTSGDGIESAGVFAVYLLYNNLSHGIRTQRAFVSYHIDGASVQPPATTFPMGIVLGPEPTAYANNPNSLPPGFATIPNQSKANGPIVTPDVLEWIVFHKDQLPELPFIMTATTYVSGLTTAGDSVETNPIDFVVEFTPDNIISPTPPDSGDTGTSELPDGVGSGTGLEGDVDSGTSGDGVTAEDGSTL